MQHLVNILASLTGAVHFHLQHHYLHHRDASRHTRGATAKWADTSTAHAAMAWKLNSSSTSARATSIRHLWNLRWYGENQALADPANAHLHGPCPLCGLLYSQTHVTWECTSPNSTRDSRSSDTQRHGLRYPSGPMRTLATAYSQLLQSHLPLEERNQLWMGLWQPQHRSLLQTHLEACSFHKSRLVLKGMGIYAATIWHLHQYLLKELCANDPEAPHQLHLPDLPASSPAPPNLSLPPLARRQGIKRLPPPRQCPLGNSR